MPTTPVKSPLRATSSNNSNNQQSLNSDEPKLDIRKSISKALVAGSDWPDNDELLDVLYWLRQVYILYKIVSAMLGVVWACIPMYGIFALALYVVASTIIGHLYITSFQKVDEDHLGGAWEMAKEGFGAGFATFMVIWIVGYSALNFPS